MMQFAWQMYAKYAWGQNELKPLSRRGHSASVFGNTALGATIVDGLDTLYLMGLKDEFKTGRDWVEKSFNFESVSCCISFRSMQIRSFLVARLTSVLLLSTVETICSWFKFKFKFSIQKFKFWLKFKFRFS